MKKTHLIFLISILLGSTTACKKAEGCMDPLSAKYDEEAEKDDGSCTYNGRVTVWFDYVTATNLVNASVPSVDIKIGGEMEGSVSMTKASAGQPACSGSDGFTATVDLGLDKSAQKEYIIYKGGTTDILQSGYVNVKGASCSWVELNF